MADTASTAAEDDESEFTYDYYVVDDAVADEQFHGRIEMDALEFELVHDNASDDEQDQEDSDSNAENSDRDEYPDEEEEDDLRMPLYNKNRDWDAQLLSDDDDEVNPYDKSQAPSHMAAAARAGDSMGMDDGTGMVFEDQSDADERRIQQLLFAHRKHQARQAQAMTSGALFDDDEEEGGESVDEEEDPEYGFVDDEEYEEDEYDYMD